MARIFRLSFDVSCLEIIPSPVGTPGSNHTISGYLTYH
jgi:hypothetical protein